MTTIRPDDDDDEEFAQIQKLKPKNGLTMARGQQRREGRRKRANDGEREPTTANGNQWQRTEANDTEQEPMIANGSQRRWTGVNNGEREPTTANQNQGGQVKTHYI